MYNNNNRTINYLDGQQELMTESDDYRIMYHWLFHFCQKCSMVVFFMSGIGAKTPLAQSFWTADQHPLSLPPWYLVVIGFSPDPCFCHSWYLAKWCWPLARVWTSSTMLLACSICSNWRTTVQSGINPQKRMQRSWQNMTTVFLESQSPKIRDIQWRAPSPPEQIGSDE
jgi:hypothetical protein